ncbi:MAG TPA: PQQ-binding-like beta-propeller repeat protein [Vicinamibacterales bacterium]|nr:PQQ-binding-like beta-propeller repeat protein [Vicinamibacterales bacterium]
MKKTFPARAMSAALACAAALLVADSAVSAENWPQFRGPDGRGVSSESAVPLEWSPDKNIAWKAQIPGRGLSEPIVWNDRLFVTTAIEGTVVPGAAAIKHMDEGQEFLHPDSVGADKHHTLKVIALDAKTGKVVWEQTAWEGAPWDNRHRRSSYAAPTPVTDGKLVYTWFGPSGLYAYDFAGKLAWKKALEGPATLGLGTGTSPILSGNLLILQCDEDSGNKSFIVALDKRDGKEVWRTPRQVQVSWATPVVVKANGRDELITSGSELIVAYDPSTGKELWRTTGVKSNAIPSPVFGHGMAFLSTGFPVKKVIAIRLGGAGDITDTPNIVWTHGKGTAYVSSPVLVGDYLYISNDQGVITCLDAKTGKVQYEGGRPPEPARFMASMVAVGDKILQTSEDGDVFVVRAGPKHEVIATNSIGEPVQVSPAIANGRIYIRGEKHLFAIGRS